MAVSRSAPESEKSRLHPAAWLYWPLCLLGWLLLHVLFRLRVRVEPAVRKVKGPLILMGNHPSNLAPVIMAVSLLPRRISILASRDFIRKRLTRFKLRRLGAIPKTQFRTGMQAIKSVLLTLRADGAVAIYPEGQRSLDGCLQPVDEAIAKLVKKMACPVVLVKEQGAYLAWPRWANGLFRPGRIAVSVTLFMTAEQIIASSVDALQRRIVSALAYDEYQLQQQNRFRYRTREPAGGMDKIIHQCPACRRELAMVSDTRSLTCRFCQNQAIVDQTGLLRPGGQGRIWPDLARWHQWQVDQLRLQMDKPGFRRGYPTRLSWPDSQEGRQPLDGTLVLTGESLLFYGSGIQADDPQAEPCLTVKLEHRTGISAEFGSYFDLAYNDQVLRFSPEPGQAVVILADVILALGSRSRTRANA